MTDKIYEYKDDQDWFVGKWSDFSRIYQLGGAGDFSKIEQEVASLIPEQQGLDIVIMRYSSDFRLLAFIVDVINETLGRQLDIKQHKGATILSEGQQLRLVHLPEQGLPLADFFSESSQVGFGDKILIATPNEGKTIPTYQKWRKQGRPLKKMLGSRLKPSQN